MIPLEYISKEPLPLQRCEFCETTRDNLQRCAGCKAVLYCTRQCQTSQWPSHKNTCKLIRARRKAYTDAEHDLRNAEPDPFIPPNVFETSIGHFYSIPETRPYMRARHELAQLLGRLDTRVSLEDMIDHGFDMLHLSRGDDLGVRHGLPAVMVRLGREQEAYDFLKWWVTHADDESYLEDMPDSPYLDLKNANALEPVDLFVGQRLPKTFDLHSLALIKIRLLLDLRKAEKVVDDAKDLPTEEKMSLLEAANLSGAITRQADSLPTLAEDPKPVVDEVTRQVREVVAALHKVNKHLLEMMIHPGPDFGSPNTSYTDGSREEAHAARSHSFRAWRGTPGAIEILAFMR
ncbi:hypothetical protein ACHAQH_006316 [Verticillium albo-atrum]